ncbi:MarR family winged helix-turn-helix transcriptional regulator [Kitasatospora purpeofusca]|uniref:MarR family winged helix-turn-helix transcriptional regulator n=1 Tax=Kitasatospora purpeofusca TaxID=67352 RepID=UPI0022527337|nr:MarR family transcriptional regulator [Kitasatospora purpeofusca]MCX4758617.1 MarR family transcriptional regulator [Kitasatospora purpeofusca]WSR30944.1 MarR family transcriptional regulator [Kitasatospora purpeofusca]
MSDAPLVHDPADRPSDGVEEDLVTAVLTASRVLVAISARSLGEAAEALTLPQFRMLVVLHSRGAMSMSRLAEYLAVNPSTAMRMIERLVAAGVVVRESSSADRREVRIALTGSGARTVADATDRRREEIARIVASMPAHQRAGLIGALHAFAEAAGEPSAPDRQLDALGW